MAWLVPSSPKSTFFPQFNILFNCSHTHVKFHSAVRGLTGGEGQRERHVGEEVRQTDSREAGCKGAQRIITTDVRLPAIEQVLSQHAQQPSRHSMPSSPSASLMSEVSRPPCADLRYPNRGRASGPFTSDLANWGQG